MESRYKPSYTNLINYIAFSLAIIVIFRWWYYVYEYSINVLYWDQWDFYDALFGNCNLWELFSWQHGPQRQGLGLVITKLIAEASGWNTRYEGFAVGSIMFIALICALILKKILFNKLSWPDIAIVLIFLTPLQYDIFVTTIFLSHGALPVLLICLYCLAWILNFFLIRYFSVIFINFLSLYTGNAVLIGFITPFILLIELYYVKKIRSNQELYTLIAALLVSVGSIIIYLNGYRFTHFVNDFQSGVIQYWNYPIFIANMFAKFVGLSSASFFIKSLLGLIPLLILIVIWLVHLKSLLLRPPTFSAKFNSSINISRVIFILISFSLIFCVTAAIGRVYLGPWTGASSRYVTLLIPGFFGLYLHLANLNLSAKKNALLLTYVSLLIMATFPLREQDYQEILMISNGKSNWIKYYLQTEDILEANQAARWKVYPHDINTTIKLKLDYLKARKLNLYIDYNR